MATSAAILNASGDHWLQQRAIALCIDMDMHESPQYFIPSKMMDFACSPVNDNGDTIATVYEYAIAQHDEKYKALRAQLDELSEKTEAVKELFEEHTRSMPGTKPDYVTDDHIRYALKALFAEKVPSSQ